MIKKQFVVHYSKVTDLMLPPCTYKSSIISQNIAFVFIARRAFISIEEYVQKTIYNHVVVAH